MSPEEAAWYICVLLPALILRTMALHGWLSYYTLQVCSFVNIEHRQKNKGQ